MTTNKPICALVCILPLQSYIAKPRNHIRFFCWWLLPGAANNTSPRLKPQPHPSSFATQHSILPYMHAIDEGAVNAV